MKSFFYVLGFAACLAGAVLARPSSTLALDPREVLVVANRKASESVGLARYYMEQRQVPEDNLLQIWVTDREKCSREDYEERIALPVLRFLDDERAGEQFRCIVLMYGVPMKLAGPPTTEAEKERMRRIESRGKLLSEQMKSTGKDQQHDIKKELQRTKKQIKKEKFQRHRSSSVDSELALVLADDYSLSMWQPNPYFIGFQDKNLSIPKEDVIMVSRLDGPDSDTVKRVIDDSMAAERKGLSGTAYFDARWPAPKEKKKSSGYGFYDQSLHLAAGKAEESGKVDVVVESTSRLFQPGECPQAALYCGWYKLAHYVDAFEWQPGAIGYHIASQECQSLKRGDYWCKRMLEDGVAATLGPVGEPYVQSFPVPEIFFSALLDGQYTLAESFLLANPYWSWKMVLVGDPLYRPFGKAR